MLILTKYTQLITVVASVILTQRPPRRARYHRAVKDVERGPAQRVYQHDAIRMHPNPRLRFLPIVGTGAIVSIETPLVEPVNHNARHPAGEILVTAVRVKSPVHRFVRIYGEIDLLVWNGLVIGSVAREQNHRHQQDEENNFFHKIRKLE